MSEAEVQPLSVVELNEIVKLLTVISEVESNGLIGISEVKVYSSDLSTLLGYLRPDESQHSWHFDVATKKQSREGG